MPPLLPPGQPTQPAAAVTPPALPIQPTPSGAPPFYPVLPAAVVTPPALPGFPTPLGAPIYQPTPPAVAATPYPPPVVAPQQPALPAVFRGCWEGKVRKLDWIQRLPGGAPIGPWTPKTYRICYQQQEAGPFKLTFTQVGVARDRRIVNPRGSLKVISTDGRRYARLQANLAFDEHYHGSSYGRTFAVSEITTLDCDLEETGMIVSGDVYGSNNGNPWFRAGWHTHFEHTEDESGESR